MSDVSNPTPGNGAADQQPQVAIMVQYVKDLSFENPNAPQSLQPGAQPRIEVGVDVQARNIAPERYEIELRVNASAKQDDKTTFLVELNYAGLFAIRNLPPESLQPFCLIECPRLLFPFARRIIADATRDGGFPPLMLEPIDFAALYRQQVMSQGQQPAGQA